MAEALKSASITNRDATPAVLNNPGVGGVGRMHQVVGSVTTTTAGASTSTYRLCEVPTGARISSIIFQAAAMTLGLFDIGLYKNTADGGAVVDQDFFATAVSASIAVAPTEILNESGTNTLTLQELPIWDAATTLTADPFSTYDVVATATTAITLGALMGVKVTYVI